MPHPDRHPRSDPEDRFDSWLDALVAGAPGDPASLDGTDGSLGRAMSGARQLHGLAAGTSPAAAAQRRIEEDLMRSGHFIAAEALGPSAESKHVRFHQGSPRVVDGPYTESKEVIAGFYLIEAGSMDEALAIGARMPGGRLGTVEVRPTVRLTVDGVEVW